MHKTSWWVRERTVAFIVIAWVLGSISFAQTVIHVPADVSTIQGGIDRASNGDTVLVSPGSYSENLDFKGKAITVTSGAVNYAGAAATIINGDQQNPVVVFHSGETRASVLNGFTIQNGRTGIYLPSTSATISNNLLINNIACGIAAAGQSAGPLILGNRISKTYPILNVQCLPYNQPYAQFDGEQQATGIWLEEVGSVEILGNTLDNNGALVPTNGVLGPKGAVIYSQTLYGSTNLTIRGNILHDNFENLSPPITISNAVAVTVTQNLIYNNFNGVGSGPSVAGLLVQDADFYGPRNTIFSIIAISNTIYGNTNQSAINAPPPSGDQALLGYSEVIQPFVIENNLFIATQQYGTVSCNALRGMITYSNNDAFYMGGSEPSHCQGSGVGNLSVDPAFLAPASGNFMTEGKSSVVAAGDVNAPDLPATDLAGKNRTVCGTVDMGVYEVHPIPQILLGSVPNPSVGGTSVTFSAHVAGNCNVPTGSLTFYDGTASLGIMPLDAGGNAVLSTAALLVGTHSITATYPGDFNFDPSTSNVVQQIVTGYPTTISLQVAPNPAKAFQQITFTATVASQFGIPTGTISFLSGSKILVTAPVNGAGVATASLNTLGAGTYNITAVCNSSLNYAASTSSTVVEIVLGTPSATSLSSSPNPSPYGQSVTFTASVTTPQSAGIPTGMVSFQEGPVVLGTAAVSNAGQAIFSTSALGVGTHSITAVYGGSPDVTTSTSNVIFQIVQPAAISLLVTGTPNPAALGGTVSFTAFTSTSSSAVSPGGNVVFSDQFGTIGSAPLVMGQATISISTLTSGTHNIVATLAAAGNFVGAVSPPYAELIQSFDFSVTLTPATLSLAAGKQGQTTVQIVGVGNLPGHVTLQATQIPMYASLGFAPGSVTFTAGGSGSSVLSVDTIQVPLHALSKEPEHYDHQPALTLAGLLTVPLLFLRRRRLLTGLASLALVAGLISMTGCTNIYSPVNRVAPGTYAIPISVTDTTTNITHTATLTLTVTL